MNQLARQSERRKRQFRIDRATHAHQAEPVLRLKPLMWGAFEQVHKPAGSHGVWGTLALVPTQRQAAQLAAHQLGRKDILRASKRLMLRHRQHCIDVPSYSYTSSARPPSWPLCTLGLKMYCVPQAPSCHIGGSIAFDALSYSYTSSARPPSWPLCTLGLKMYCVPQAPHAASQAALH